MFQTKQAPAFSRQPCLSEFRRPRGAPTKPLAYKRFLMFQRPVCTVSRSCAPRVSASLDSAWYLPDLSPTPGLSWPGWASRSRDRGCLGPTILGCLQVDVALLPGSFQSKLPPTGGSKQETRSLAAWRSPRSRRPQGGSLLPLPASGLCLQSWGLLAVAVSPQFLPPASPGSCSLFSCEDPCPWT